MLQYSLRGWSLSDRHICWFVADAFLIIQKNDDDDENPYGKRDVLSDILSLLTGLSSLDLSGLSSDLGKEHGPIGVNCSPMDESSGGAGNCTASPMCCNNNRFVGVALISSLFSFLTLYLNRVA
jgi:hypothetical protein